MWIDSHTHLNDEAFQDDYQAVIKNSSEAGIERMLVVGYDIPSSMRAVQLAQSNDFIYAAVGVHPHDAKLWDASVEEQIRKMLSEPGVVAVGEIGLDYHYNYSQKEDQLRIFKGQLAIAKEYDKPVIIHNREAHQDTYDVLEQAKIGPAGGVMHCFSGSWEMAKQFLELGLYISFAGSLTFKNADKLRGVALKIPEDRILIETDCPYLTPHPFRGDRNEPSRVTLVGEKLAEIKQVPLTEIAGLTTRNAKNLFGI